MGIGQQIINGTDRHKMTACAKVGREMPPKSAFEDLLEWCDRYMNHWQYRAVEESRSYHRAVYLNTNQEDISCLYFDRNGNFIDAETLTNEDMLEHIRDLEATERERGTISCEK